MELGLSLGTQKPFKLFGISNELVVNDTLGFCMGLASSVTEEMSSKRLHPSTITDRSLYFIP